MKYITFNGRSSNDPLLGIGAVKRVQSDVLPETNDHFLKVTGMDGVYDFGKDRGPRYEIVQFVIFADSNEQRYVFAERIAEWLETDEVKELLFSDRPDRRFMARVVGRIKKDVLGRDGYCDVTFIAPSGYSEAVEETNVSGLTINNNGTAHCSCTIACLVQTATDDLKVSLNANVFLLLHGPFSVNDVVVFDTHTRKVTVNDLDARAEVDITSNFKKFQLPPGETTLTVIPADTICEVEFRERYK